MRRMIKNMWKWSVVLLVVVGVFQSCKDDEMSFDERFAIEQAKIDTYLRENNLSARETSTGIHLIDQKIGEGDSITSVDVKVEVGYKGSRLNGEIFDQTPSSKPSTFELSNLIEGWKQGMQGMKTGGIRTMIIPSHLGYGDRESRDIPAHSILIFEVELISIEH